MGKTKKNITKKDNKKNALEKEDTIQEETITKLRKSKKKSEEILDDSDKEEASHNKIKNKNLKPNKQCSDNVENVDGAPVEDGNEVLKVYKAKRKTKDTVKLEENVTKNKKLKLGNEEPVPTSNKVKTTKKLKYLNDDEAEVKDEDIDKFCDELNDEDNEQYENWVKLFEANFRSNKKKT